MESGSNEDTDEGSVGAVAPTGPPSVRRSAGVHGAERNLTLTWPGPGGGVVAPGPKSLLSFSTLSIGGVDTQAGGVSDSPRVA